MSATIKDIARETGLALATISKYINGGTVRPQNKKQIDEAIRKLNYVPRNTARGLRSSKTYRIGLVSGPPNNPHNAFLLSKIENTMRAHGYSLTFMSGDKYKDHVNKFVPHMLRSGIDGLETSLPLTYTELVEKDVITLKQMVEKMCLNPAKILGLDRGTLQKGHPADVIIVDTEQEYAIDKNKFVSKGHNTPFDGWKVKGKVLYTICDGKIVFKNQEEKES